MYCPQCSQQQISDELRFCSRCGFPLSDLTKLVAAGGTLSSLEEESKSLSSPRRRGIQQAVILIFISILLIPLVDVIASPYHEALIFMFLLGGILRAVYAFAFQEGAKFKLPKRKENSAPSQLGANPGESALPPSPAAPLNFGNRRMETAKIVQPSESVTENTTRLLDDQQ